MSNFYEVLGLKIQATPDEIRKNYRELVKKFHPDRNPLHTKRFEEITCAYSTLVHPEKRKQYDLKLQENKELRTGKSFRFREFKTWLFQFRFIQTLFGGHRVTAPPQQSRETVQSLQTRELLKRVMFSNNIFVQTTAVQAILEQADPEAINDMLRLLYSGINEAVKMAIIEGIRKYHTPHVTQVLQEVYETEKNIRIKQSIRRSLTQSIPLN